VKVLRKKDRRGIQSSWLRNPRTTIAISAHLQKAFGNSDNSLGQQFQLATESDAIVVHKHRVDAGAFVMVIGSRREGCQRSGSIRTGKQSIRIAMIEQLAAEADVFNFYSAAARGVTVKSK
jgi:hypothetical protein